MMKEELFNQLANTSGTVTTNQIIVNFIIATILGGVIFISYLTSHTRVVYSARFNVSLIMLTVITTLVMSVIGNNIALSLGMVGALSIVRFRTAVKDPRDTAYIFWCVAVGICCGVSDYVIAGIGTCFIFVVLLIFGNIRDNNRYLLVIRGNRNKEDEIINTVISYYKNKGNLKVNNSTLDKTEFIYELSEKIVKRNKNKKSVSEVLYDLGGIESVNLVCQNDEMGR